MPNDIKTQTKVGVPASSNRNGSASDIMVDQIRAVSLERFDAFIEVLRGDISQRLKDIIARMYAV
jgi:hypothetical protein